MIQEERKLLLKVLCAMLPYKCVYSASRRITHWNKLILNTDTITKLINNEYDEIKPYLRPMSSMTEEEKEEYCDLQDKFLYSSQYPVTDAYKLFDWLNTHHFDYRIVPSTGKTLIESGLAIEAPEGMYKIE